MAVIFVGDAVGLYYCTLFVIASTAGEGIVISSFQTRLQLAFSYSLPDRIHISAARLTSELRSAGIEYHSENSRSYARIMNDLKTQDIHVSTPLLFPVTTETYETDHAETLDRKTSTTVTSSEVLPALILTSPLLESSLQATVVSRYGTHASPVLGLNSTVTPFRQASNWTSAYFSVFSSKALNVTRYGTLPALPSPVTSFRSSISMLPQALQSSLIWTSSTVVPNSSPFSSFQPSSAYKLLFTSPLQLLGSSASSMWLTSIVSSPPAGNSSFTTVGTANNVSVSLTICPSPSPTLQAFPLYLNCNSDYPPYSCNCYMCQDKCCIDRLSNNARRNAVLVTFTMADIETYQAMELQIKSVVAQYLDIYCISARKKCLGTEMANNELSADNIFSNRDVTVFQIVRLSIPMRSLQLAFVVKVPTHLMSFNVSTNESNGILQTAHKAEEETTSGVMAVKGHYVPAQVVVEVMQLYRKNMSSSIGFSIVNGSIKSFVSEISVNTTYGSVHVPTSSITWQLPDGNSDDNRTMIIIIVCALCGCFLLVIVFVIVCCYVKQRKKSFSLTTQGTHHSVHLQEDGDYELGEIRKSSQGAVDTEMPQREASVGLPVHKQHGSPIYHRKQSHTYDPEKGKQLEYKLIPPVSSPHHSRRIRHILKRSKTCAISPELVLDDDSHQLFSETTVGIPISLNRSKQTQVAWETTNGSVSVNYGMPILVQKRHIKPATRDTSNAHPSTVRTQDLPTPRPILEPRVTNDLQFPTRSSTVVQMPEVLRSPKRRLPKLLASKTLANV